MHHLTIISLSGVRRQTGTNSWRRKVVVDRNSFSCVGSVFHARGAATEKAVSPIRRRVLATTRSTDDEAGSADRARTSATDVSKSEMYTLTTLTLTFEPIPNRNFFSGTPRDGVLPCRRHVARACGHWPFSRLSGSRC